MHAASRESLVSLTGRVDELAPSIGDPGAVAEALFAVTGVLGANPTLRRTLAESSSPGEDRAGLARRLFGGRIPSDAATLLGEVVARRWSAPWDLVDAVERAGNQVLLAAAERDGRLDDVEDQLFRFSRIVGGDATLRRALDDRQTPADRRAGLARTLLEGRADAVTVALAAQAVRSTSHPSVDLTLGDLLEVTAARRQRSIAVVRTAVALTDAQIERLAAVLSRMYDRRIDVRVDLDPAIVGGLVVRVADEVIDGSVAGRLAAARTGLAAQ